MIGIMWSKKNLIVYISMKTNNSLRTKTESKKIVSITKS